MAARRPSSNAVPAVFAAPRRATYDLEHTVFQQMVASISEASAFHVTNAIFSMTTATERAELAEEFAREFRGSRPLDVFRIPGRENSAPQLCALIERGQARHAENLRDHRFRDVSIIFRLDGIGELADALHRHFFEVKEKFEKAGFAPYFLRERTQQECIVVLSVVAPADLIRTILSQLSYTEEEIKVIDNTVPAGKQATLPMNIEPDPECIFWYRESDVESSRTGKVVVVNTPPRRLSKCGPPLPDRSDSSDGDQARWSVFSRTRPCGNAQPKWTKENAPFSREIYDPESNANWWQKDLRIRKAQLGEQEASKHGQGASNSNKSSRESASSPLPGLCDTYPESRNEKWYKNQVVPSMKKELAQAEFQLASKEKTAANVKDALRNARANEVQTPDNPTIAKEASAWEHRMKIAIVEVREAQSVVKRRRQELKAACGKDASDTPEPYVKADGEANLQLRYQDHRRDNVESLQLRGMGCEASKEACETAIDVLSGKTATGDSEDDSPEPSRPGRRGRHVRFEVPASSRRPGSPPSPPSSESCKTPVDSFMEGTAVGDPKNLQSTIAIVPGTPPPRRNSLLQSCLQAFRFQC